MKHTTFEDQLNKVGLNPDDYLNSAKILAKKSGYDPDKLKLCSDGDHKLELITPENKKVKFGKVGYNDFILWNWLELNKEVPEGTANKRRALYHKRADNMKGDWKDNKYSSLILTFF